MNSEPRGRALRALTGAGINLGQCALPARHPDCTHWCSGAVIGFAWQRLAENTTSAVVNPPELVWARHAERSQAHAHTCETSR